MDDPFKKKKSNKKVGLQNLTPSFSPLVIGQELYLPATVFAIKLTYLYRQAVQSELLSESLSMHDFTV